MRWHESPKGYTTKVGVRVCTVFYKGSQWSCVVDGAFNHGFASVHAAMDFAESTYGFSAERMGVQNVPPANRTDPAREYARSQPNHAWGRQQREQADFLEQIRRAKARARQQQQGGGIPSYEEFMRQSQYRAPAQPWWAVTLKLPGHGPWKITVARAAFATLAKTHHPDMGGTAEMIQKINEAWKAAKQECQA